MPREVNAHRFPCSKRDNVPLDRCMRLLLHVSCVHQHVHCAGTCANIHLYLCVKIAFYNKSQLRRTQLFTCYMSTTQRHLQLIAPITAKGFLQKSESLRAEPRYCQCGLGDNYLLNKLPKPLAKHTTYPRKSCAVIKPRKTIDGFFISRKLGGLQGSYLFKKTDPHRHIIGRVTGLVSRVC